MARLYLLTRPSCGQHQMQILLSRLGSVLRMPSKNQARMHSVSQKQLWQAMLDAVAEGKQHSSAKNVVHFYQ